MISLYNLFETENQDGQYKIPMINRNKEKRLNSKTSRNTKYLFTDIPPEKRDLENLPRYANKKPKVRFQDWLEIDAKKLNSNYSVTSWGWSPNGRCYGWSHRAIYGFKVGDTVTPDTCGNPTGKEYVIKTKEQAEEAAKNFAKDVS